MRRRRKSRVRLLEIAVRWPPESFVGWKLEGLAADGMRVSVASNRIMDPGARLRGVELVPIPSPAKNNLAALPVVARDGAALLIRSPSRLLKLIRNVRSLPDEAKERHRGTLRTLSFCLAPARLRPDVVHFEWHRSAVDYLPLFDVFDCPVTTSCRGSDTSVYPHLPGFEEYAGRLPEVYARVAAVHCVSESLKQEAVALGLDPAKAWVARPGVDPDVFAPAAEGRAARGRNDGALRLVTVGWLRWEKGFEYALEALRGLVDRGVPAQLEIIGSVPPERRGWLDEEQRILHTAADLGLSERISLTGHATSAEISRRLQENDVLLHASVTEGIPAAVVEAMACGVPVVAARCGGVHEAVADGVEGVLVAPRDPGQLVDAVQRLWDDPALRRRMGQAGRRRVLSEFALEGEHQVHRAMYRQVVSV